MLVYPQSCVQVGGDRSLPARNTYYRTRVLDPLILYNSMTSPSSSIENSLGCMIVPVSSTAVLKRTCVSSGTFNNTLASFSACCGMHEMSEAEKIGEN